MGVKNMFKKSSKLFDKEGFYIVLFVCLCVVAVAAVYMSRNNANTAKKLAEGTKNIEEKGPADSTLVENKGNDKTVPTNTKPATNNTSSTSTKTGSSTSKPASTTPSFKIDMPVVGEITKEYADYAPVYSETLKLWETHEALDIQSDIGTEVKAVYGGKVTKVNTEDVLVTGPERTGLGVTVEIDHGNGFKSVYSNLSEDVKVQVGKTVKKGDVIGYVGETSNRELTSVEGPHLHFALLKKNGKDYVEVDPTKYLPQDSAKKESDKKDSEND